MWRFTYHLSVKHLHHWGLALLFGGLIGFKTPLLAQMTQEDFGKNRVQYRNFIWSHYETDNFSVYFSQGGKNLGRYIVETAESTLRKIGKKLEYRINTPMQIIVYNNLTDMRQNNIGRGLDIYNTGGVTQIIGTKIFLYFNGNHVDLKRQLREGIAKVFIKDMMYGGNIQDAVQNAVLLNLPKWYTEGLVSYVGEEWSTALDNRLRDGVLSGQYDNFYRLSGEDTRFAGHSVWNFIAQKYGKSAIPNMLYLTRINRSLESGFLFVLGKTVQEALQEWERFYEKRYTAEEENFIAPPDSNIVGKRPKRRPRYYETKLHPDGRYIAYVTNHIGRYKVKIYDKKKNSRNTILRGGYRSIRKVTDYSFPQLDWSPDGEELAILYEKKDEIRLRRYDIESGDHKEGNLNPYFQKVTDFSYTDNPHKIALTAVNQGQSDLYLFNVLSHHITRITEDYYDDRSPHYINVQSRQGTTKRGILFISNRPTPSLEETTTRKMDTLRTYHDPNLYFYNLNTQSKQLTPVTHTPVLRESDPQQYDRHHLSFLSDQNGIRNRFVGYFDTTFSHFDTMIYQTNQTLKNPGYAPSIYQSIPNDSIDSMQLKPVYKDTVPYYPVTNRNRNILEQDLSPTTQQALDLMLHHGRYYFYLSKLNKNPTRSNDMPPLTATTYRNNHPMTSPTSPHPQDPDTKPSDKEPKDTTSSSPLPYHFQTPEAAIQPSSDTTPDQPDGAQSNTTTAEKSTDFRRSEISPYFTKFSTEYVLSQLDNTIMFTPYQNYTGSGPVYNPPKLSPMFELSITDLFEDYRFTGGFRVPTNFSGSEYFFSFQHLKKRLDKQITYYRRVNSKAYDFRPFWNPTVFGKVKTNYLEGKLTWPFSATTSLRGYFGYRNDQVTFQARDTFSLHLPNYTENWFSARLEYVFDNTIEWNMNTLEGTRFKLFGEAQRMINDVKIRPVDIRPDSNHFFSIGADFRNYINLYREIIFANRFTAGTSLGPRKVVYYLGGVDNWLFPKFNNQTPISQQEQYAFQTLATNMRGFQQNIRNGNSYAVINSELRIPFFRLTNLFMNSKFFRNFQFIGFGDIGTAWIGLHPFSQENPLSTETIGQPPVEVRVDYLRNPIVQGYGFGARSTILGYFLRFDVAWGLEDREFNKPQYYLSLSLDF